MIHHTALPLRPLFTRPNPELRIAGVVLTSQGVGTQDQIQCALYQPDKWVSQRVVLTLASAKDTSDSIQCIREANATGVVCTSTGAIPGVVMPPKDLAALEISVLFDGTEGHEYRCSVQVGEVTAVRKVYAELVEIGVYFTDAHRQGEVYLTETVSKAFCGYYNDIVFHRASTMINICDVAGKLPVDAPENGFLIGKVVGNCVTAVNVEINVTCNFTAVVGDHDISSNLTSLTATQVVKIFPKCAKGHVIEEGVCQKCETGYRNQGMSQFEGCQACEEAGEAAGPTRGGCIPCKTSQNEVSRAGMSCETCPSGTEANSTTQTCDVCIPGEKAGVKEKCTACPVGEYSTVAGSPLCTACLPGHFQNQTGKTSCSQCPAGKYQPKASQAECLECPAGQYSDQTASPTCTICSPGTFQGQTGQQRCIKCPAGHYQSTAGATLCLECDIAKGQYQPTEGSTWCMVTQPGSMLIPGGPGTLPTGCQAGLKGGNYRGTIDVTKSGKKCQKWNVESPQVPTEGLKHPSAKFPNEGLGDHNYCRNPDGMPNLWCYTIDEDKRHEECNIPKCEGAASNISVKQCGYNEFSTGGMSACTACNKANKEYSSTKGSTYCEVCSTELNDGYPFCNKFKCLESSVTSKAVNSSGETYTFNETLVGGVFSVPCNSNPDKVEPEYITRYCKMVSPVLTKWSSLDYTQCTNQNTAAIQNALKWDMKNLKNGTRDMSGLLKGKKLLPQDIVLVGKGLSSFKKETLQGDIDTIGNVANIVASLATNTESLTVIDNSDKAVILATMDTLVDSMESGNSLTAGTMGLSVIKGGAALPSTEHMNATDVPKLSISGDLEVAVVVFSSEVVALFPAPTAEEYNDGTAKVNKSLESSIVSMKVAGNFSSFKLELSSDSSGDEEKHGKGKVFERTCQFLDTTDNTWSTEGCVTTLLESGKYECECTHNTSFAILLSVSEIKDTSQDTASTVMGAFNLVFLVLTFLSLAPFKKFRQRQLMQIQINLVLSLILANVGFIILSYTTTVTVNELGEPLMSLNVGCIAGTVIVQWLFLSVMAWMTCAAYTLYGKIVDALKTYGKTDRFYLLKCSIGCWLFPVILPIAACVTSYGMNDSKGEYTSPYVGANANFENGTSCWVDAPWKWVSFFLPCWACLIVNFVMIAMIARVIIRSAKSGSSAGGNHAREIKALVTIAFTVGVPWIFAALTIGVIAQVFQWLFIIVTGLQGLGMFICFVIFQEDVLNNLFSLVGQSPPAFLMAPKTRSPKELATAKPTTSVTRVERDDTEEEEEAAIEFKEGDDMTQNIYSNMEATEKEEKEGKDEDGVRREPELV